MAFTHRLRVRYAEVDRQGVVFNAHWLAYFDDAFNRFVEHLGFDPAEAFEGPFDVRLVRSELEWHGPAGFEDVLEIDVAPSRLGSSSFDITFAARVDGAPVCTATTTYVSVHPHEARSRPIPEDVRAALETERGGKDGEGTVRTG